MRSPCSSCSRQKLDKHSNNLTRAAVELAKEWRTDRRLGRLEAMLAVADKDACLLISGNGDVLEPEHGLIAIGSGGPFAQAAAMALLEHSALPARADRGKGAEDRRRHLHLHQSQRDD